jgi:predicted AAA+ superfamily ATPase
LTRNISAFSRFLEVASFSQGSLLNMAEIAREVGIDRQVIKNYFSIVDDLLIGYHINPFTKRAKRRLILHAKFYFFDTGVYRVLRPKGPLDSKDEIDGAGLETIFLQSILAVNEYYNLGYTFYFWRSSNGLEVDFIAYGPKGFHAFEIKHTTNITGKSLNGLHAFQKDYPEASLNLLYTGDRREYHGDINIIPMVAALAELPQILGS